MWLIIPTLTASFASCSQEEQKYTSSTRKAAITFSVNGISESDNQSLEKKVQEPEVITKSIGNDWTMESTLALNPSESHTRASGMSAGNTYRVIVYKSGIYVAHKDYVAGNQETADKFSLEVNTAYTYVAYSYNTNVPISDGYASGDAVLSGIDPSKDLLYASGSFSTGAVDSNTSISIVFAHKFSLVVVVADATVNQYNITSASATITPGYTANLSLTDGVVTSSGASATQAISWLGAETGKLYSSVPRTVFTNASASLTLTFSSININGIDYTSGLSTSFSTVMVAGKKYTLTVKFRRIPSITITSGNLKWAKGNLYETSTPGTYAIFNNQEDFTTTRIGGDHWCWGATNPRTTPTNITTASVWTPDPCTKALGGTWRMPTDSEINNLKSLANVWTYKNGKTGRYFGISAAPAAADQDKYLFLPAADAITYPSSTSIDVNAVGVAGYYWSSGGALSNNSQAIHMGFSSPVAPYAILQYHQYALSIRCVSPN